MVTVCAFDAVHEALAQVPDWPGGMVAVTVTVVPGLLLPVPASVLELCATLLGKRAVAQRLCGSLQVDIAKTCRLLGWIPPLTLDQGLRKAVEGMEQ